jgi:hypothetical protein
MSTCIVLVNKVDPKTSLLAAQVTADWLTRVAAACQTQLSEDVAPIHGGSFVVSAAALANEGESEFDIDWQLLNAPGAEAYHDWQTGKVVAFEALSTCATLDDVSKGISHELCEILGDPGCNQWVDDGQGGEYARELCDACQDSSYVIDGVAVSNFLLPTFFEPNAKGPFSFLGTKGTDVITAPFATAPGGYQIRRDPGTGETQVTGQILTRRPAFRIVSPVSRSYRRLQQKRKRAV